MRRSISIGGRINLFQAWNNAFVFADGVWQLSDTSFSNGFRYMNWSIDVPMLLLQLVVVLGLTRSQAISYGTKFIIGGLLMVWTGYVGQFYEVTNLTQLFIWGTISTVFYIYVLFVIGQMINKNANNLPTQPDNLPKAMRGYFLVHSCHLDALPDRLFDAFLVAQCLGCSCATNLLILLLKSFMVPFSATLRVSVVRQWSSSPR
jgi:Bacteriorhodopsin-like protein